MPNPNQGNNANPDSKIIDDFNDHLDKIAVSEMIKTFRFGPVELDEATANRMADQLERLSVLADSMPDRGEELEDALDTINELQKRCSLDTEKIASLEDQIYNNKIATELGNAVIKAVKKSL